MAFQQNFSGITMNYGSEGNVPHKQMPNSSPQRVDNPNGCFDCNICLDSCHDPIVTLCGHLYCWPCIYKWLKVEHSSAESDEHPKCPVCKSHISTSTLVPLYGRGMFGPEAKKSGPLDSTIPHRPPASVFATGNYQNHQNHRNPFEPDNQAYQQHQYLPHSLAGPSSRSFYSPTINMVGELVFARMFGSQDTNLFGHPYSNYSHLSGNGSLRLRRQEMRLDKSLNRVSIFLFCCIILCLILF